MVRCGSSHHDTVTLLILHSVKIQVINLGRWCHATGASLAADLVISDSSFIENEALAGYGGAISLGVQRFHKLRYCANRQQHFEEYVQSSSSANGGAILVNTSSSDDVLFSGVLFDSNIAHSSGGAVHQWAQDVDISTSGS